MRRSSAPLLVVLALVASACGGVDDLTALRDRASEVSDQAGEVADRARFCFAVTRALTGVEGGTSTDEAYDAAEEVLAQVPDELRDDANTVADHLRRAAEQDDAEALRDPAFQEAAERLRDGTRELCDPTG